MTRGEAIAQGNSMANGPGSKPREVAEVEVTRWTLGGAW